MGHDGSAVGYIVGTSYDSDRSSYSGHLAGRCYGGDKNPVPPKGTNAPWTGDDTVPVRCYVWGRGKLPHKHAATSRYDRPPS